MKNNYKYKWKYNDEERPRGRCYDCGLNYTEFSDMIIPDELWEEINPTYEIGAGILCPTAERWRRWTLRWRYCAM